jgi:hypothetical protein
MKGSTEAPLEASREVCLEVNTGLSRGLVGRSVSQRDGWID